MVGRVVESPFFWASVDDLKVMTVQMKWMLAWVVVVEDDYSTSVVDNLNIKGLDPYLR